MLCPGWVRTKINESERNRPDQPPVGELDPATLAMKEMVNSWISEGLQPAHVASLVLEAIRANRFWILTHPEWQNMVSDRVDRMLSGEQPKASLPAN